MVPGIIDSSKFYVGFVFPCGYTCDKVELRNYLGLHQQQCLTTKLSKYNKQHFSTSIKLKTTSFSLRQFKAFPWEMVIDGASV